MLRDSDNVATGVVVDAITGAPNGPVEGADYDAWFARRLYTENLLAQHDLLAGQKFINKTYPTNSGEEPAGLEALARERHGRNSMNADGAANLMLALVTGEFGEPAAEYIRSRLRRPLVSRNSSMGGGFPEGTVYESKIGDAYDTLAEIVHAELAGRAAPHHRRVLERARSGRARRAGPDCTRRILEAPDRTLPCPMTERADRLRGVILMIAAVGVFAVMDALMKHISVRYPRSRSRACAARARCPSSS